MRPGMIRLVIDKKTSTVWPWLVIRSICLRIWVTQITAVRLIRMTRKLLKLVLKMYLSKIHMPLRRARFPQRGRDLARAYGPCCGGRPTPACGRTNRRAPVTSGRFAIGCAEPARRPGARLTYRRFAVTTPHNI